MKGKSLPMFLCSHPEDGLVVRGVCRSRLVCVLRRMAYIVAVNEWSCALGMHPWGSLRGAYGLQIIMKVAKLPLGLNMRETERFGSYLYSLHLGCCGEHLNWGGVFLLWSNSHFGKPFSSFLIELYYSKGHSVFVDTLSTTIWVC